ncbi:unnamed protein product [Lactuca saligna]|uniref:Uncharacterized protein n=1 Tax=Lactuca saligna TaxID=75948 RepID=A0AA35ZBT8_LACSI|nr:unnamed protein product [Lactuca saligna]
MRQYETHNFVCSSCDSCESEISSKMELDLHVSQTQASKEIVLEEHVSLVSSIKKKMLKAMEDYKWKYLNTLLSRATNVEARLGKCIETLKVLEDKARKCYGEEIHMQSDEFVEMMLIDGCFIIELFNKSCCKGTRRRGDPFLATYEVFYRLRHDLILLENQIPFFILDHLFHIVPTPKQCGDYSLIELAFRFFKKTVHEDPYYIRERYGQEIHHLLDLIHQSFIPKTHIFQLHSKQPLLKIVIPKVTELHRTGAEIKGSKSRNILEVKLNNGVLTIPNLIHHDLMEIVLRNLIAMENCCYDATKYVTSYAFLMKSLIQSIDDAKFLLKKRIFDKDEDFFTLFDNISIDVDAKDFYYGELCEDFDKFAKVDINIRVKFLQNVREALRNVQEGGNRRQPRYDEHRVVEEFKASELPKFVSGTDPEHYLEWKRKIKRMFGFKEVDDEKRCKYAILKLSGGASWWFEGLKAKRTHEGKKKNCSWLSLKRKLIKNIFLLLIEFPLKRRLLIRGKKR